MFLSMYQNYQKGYKCRYFGYGRTSLTDNSFRSIVKKAVGQDDKVFLNRFRYIQGSYDTKGLKTLIGKINPEKSIYYLSIPSNYNIVKDLVLGLKQNNLIGGDSLIAIEKPFGDDYKTANKLAKLLYDTLGKGKLFFVDHYLSKDLVRNLISLRFANPIFENQWNNKFIKKIEIESFESIDIKNRGQYYDKTGAIKDMIQNHGLQVLSLVTMNIPKSFNLEDFQREKDNVLKRVRLFHGDYKENINIGQYKGYLLERFIRKNSKTETYASILFEVDNERWKGVPITVITGKKLQRKSSKIIIYFKSYNECLWNGSCNKVSSNELTIDLAPPNSIELTINTNFQPTQTLPKKKMMVFHFNDKQVFNLPYSNALRDIYQSEKTFTSSLNQILFSWRIIDTIEEWLKDKRGGILKIY